jgi:predicted Zn-dependent protease
LFDSVWAKVMSSQIEDLTEKTVKHALVEGAFFVKVKGSLIGALHSNLIAGDLVSADIAFKIEDGRIAHPLKACTVAENLYGVLKSVAAIGSRSNVIGSIVCPSLIVDGVVPST